MGKILTVKKREKQLRRYVKHRRQMFIFWWEEPRLNFTVISSILRPFQGVICADSGHINIHETGAVEATGHKVLALPSKDGKITGQQIKEYYDLHWSDESREHIVQPKMVYISHPTEVGTLYTKAELEDISSICKECGLYLFLDGARMG